jgi:hypothetical protein
MRWVKNALNVCDEAVARFGWHERGDFMHVGDHGEAAVVAETFLKYFDGI